MTGRRRANHEGSIYQRGTDGRWMGALVGYDDRGRPRRKYVSAKTRTEVARRLRQLRREVDDGLVTVNPSTRLHELFERWFDDVMRHQVAASTLSNYRSVTAFHILPTLGQKRLADLTVKDVDTLLSKKLDSGLSPSTVRRIRAVLAQCLD
jgi:hypothetical protein